jgi:hypothetical protein
VRAVWALLLSLGAAVFVFGCGGSQSTQRTFADRANAICREYRARVAKLPRPKTLAAEVRYSGQVLVHYRRALRDLEALEPPPERAARYRRWLAAVRVVERDVMRIRRAAQAGRSAELQAAVAKGRIDDRRSSRLARQLGLTACARA